MRIASKTRLAAGTIAAIALVGCGGPEVQLGRGGPATLAGDYERAAGETCRRVAEQFASIQAEPPRTFAQGAEVVAALVGVAQEGEEQLRSIEVPEDRAEAFSDYLDARAEAIAELERAGDAAEAEDGEAYERARDAAIGGAGERARLARRAGLEACARVEAG